MIVADGLGYRGILHEVSLQIPDTGVVGLVGPNGSGKTTLLRCLSGALRPTAGTLCLDGRELSKMPAREIARRIAVVSQDGGEPPPMTVADIVRLGRLPHGDCDEDLIAAALREVGMLDLARRPMTQLSGGERQRAMIARAYVQDTTHTFLDEPTNHLDIFYQLELCEQIRRRSANTIVVLHDLTLALRYCDTVYVVDDGRIAAGGPAATVLVPEVLEPIYRVRVIRDADHIRCERL